LNEGFVVQDAGGQPLAYVYFEDETAVANVDAVNLARQGQAHSRRTSRSCRSCRARVNEARTMMDRDMAGRQLDDLPSGDSMDIDKDTLGMLFPPGETAGVIDPRTRSAATKFAQDHNCRFLFDDQSSKSTFLKLPGRWYELIENVCTDLGRETPGTESFRVNLDYKISEAEARASQSEAIPIGETPEQRKQEFQEALRKILHVGQDRDSSNKKVWTEALHLLDNPRVRVSSHKPPKR
jgi:hypothetical protein